MLGYLMMSAKKKAKQERVHRKHVYGEQKGRFR